MAEEIKAIELDLDERDRFETNGRERRAMEDLEAAHKRAMFRLATELQARTQELWEDIGDKYGLDIKNVPHHYHDGQVRPLTAEEIAAAGIVLP